MTHLGKDVDVAGVTYTIWADAPKRGTYHAFRIHSITGERVWSIIGQRGGRWKWLAASHEVERVEPAKPTGKELKEEGIMLALMPGTLDEWKAEFNKAVDLLCESRVTFTSEDVLDLVGLPSGTIKSNANNAVGAMMNALARSGEIRKTGERRPSKRPSSHGAELAVWASARASEPDDRQGTADPVRSFRSDDGRIFTLSGGPIGTNELDLVVDGEHVHVTAVTPKFNGIDTADTHPYGLPAFPHDDDDDFVIGGMDRYGSIG